MTFRRKDRAGIGARAKAGIVAFAVSLGFITPAVAQMGGTAVVPTRTIYPGEQIGNGAVDEVEITNPNLTGDYARSASEVVGMVAKRTLVPGRIIPPSALREAFAVKRGAPVRLTFSIGPMVISASGSPLDNAAVGDIIKVRNMDSGITVSGTVMADGSVAVMAK